MNKKFTNEEVVKAAKHCATNVDCDNCPFSATLGIEDCIENFAQYIVDTSKQTHMQDVLNDFERYISPLFTADQLKAYDVGKSYQALKQLTELAGEQSD